MKIIVFEPNKDPEVREIPDGDAAYESVKTILGGYLQILPLKDTCDAYVDDEAKIKDEPCVPNPLATVVLSMIIHRDGRAMIPGDYIANTMVVVGVVNANGEVDGDWHDLRQEDIDDVLEVAKAVKLFIK